MCRKLITIISFVVLFTFSVFLSAQEQGELTHLMFAKKYESKRISSFDRSGRNDDGQWRNQIQPGETRALAEIQGPGIITHIWITIATPDKEHLKRLVLRFYWDGEENPSVEAPVGDFFGLGLGKYFHFESGPVMIGTDHALNCFWKMPFRKSAKVTVTYEAAPKPEGADAKALEEYGKNNIINAFYYYVDYEKHESLPDDILYFHAQYNQAVPCDGYTDWLTNGQPEVNHRINLDGKDNYVFLQAGGRGHYVGVFHSILQNQDDWWGEGDDMIFIDGSKSPILNGTGSEDYYCGAWGFGKPYFYRYAGCNSPEENGYVRGAEWNVYRLHLESPVAFTKEIRVTMEHGHANHRSDNWYTCAFWYQTEPHRPFPALPPAKDRIPRKINLGGKGFNYHEEDIIR